MINKNEKLSEIPAEQLSLRSVFQFDCHKNVKCFTNCCRGIDIMLTPYDILTMAKRLDLSSEEFLASFTQPQLLEKADLPVVTLRLLDDAKKSCPFVEDKKGCLIYEDRPTTCRYYPLGTGALSYSGGKEGKQDEFFFMVKEAHCLGFKEKKQRTIAQWRIDQDIDLRDEINEGWLDLIVRKKSLPFDMKLTQESKQMFFMACYNIDKFKEFVFKSSFLKRYNLSDKKINEISNSDISLLKFGFDWLKASFFKIGTKDFKPNNL